MVQLKKIKMRERMFFIVGLFCRKFVYMHIAVLGVSVLERNCSIVKSQ